MGFQKSYARWKNRKVNEKAAIELKFLKALNTLRVGKIDHVIDNLPHSKSQFFQDCFVLSMLDFKTEGYFVEFGAEDGKNISNTYLLEKKFGWNGILSEPARGSQYALKYNRDVHVDEDCVWHTSDEKIVFWEFSFASLSGIPQGLQKREKELKWFIKRRKEYSVNTVSLEDLLQRYGAPHKIDYLSIDTEGTEIDILRNFDFNKYKFSVITIEHNFTNDREEQFSLLKSNGYKRVLKSVSQNDDWYILN